MNIMKVSRGKNNPDGAVLYKGKMRAEEAYKPKTTFLNNDGLEVLVDILKSGGQAELQKRGMLDNGAEYLVVKIYFVNDEK